MQQRQTLAAFVAAGLAWSAMAFHTTAAQAAGVHSVHHHQTVFPIEVQQQLNELPIAVNVSSSSRVTLVHLQNQGNQAALCYARFRNGPELPRTRRNRLEPGETALLTYTVRRAVNRMRVQVFCKQAENGDASAPRWRWNPA